MDRLSTITWPEIFAHWRAGEAANPGWIRTATEVKGWPDWESWRMFTANQLSLPQRSWSVFAFTEPMKEIPALLIGPYTGWQSRLPQSNTASFADLVDIPEQYQHFHTNPTIQKIMKEFPADTMLTGLKNTDGSVVLVEGHHRAAAVAIAQHDGQAMTFSKPVQIALADFTSADDNLLDRVLARGSTKNFDQSS